MTNSAHTTRLRHTASGSLPIINRSHAALLLLALFLFSLHSAAREPLSELRKRADAAHGSDCAKLCLETAHALAEESFSHFKQGDAETAQSALNDAMNYAQRGAQESIASKKYRKETEISLRKLARRLTDLERLLAVEQRTPLESDVATLEQLRSQLLSSLFTLKEQE